MKNPSDQWLSDAQRCVVRVKGGKDDVLRFSSHSIYLPIRWYTNHSHTETAPRVLGQGIALNTPFLPRASERNHGTESQERGRERQARTCHEVRVLVLLAVFVFGV
jgi:hypothetical protein